MNRILQCKGSLKYAKNLPRDRRMFGTNIPKLLFTAGILLGLSADANAQSTTFSYTGASQTYAVPSGVTALAVDIRGASGGNSTIVVTTRPGGGRVQTTLSVTPGQVLQVEVGGQGSATASGGYNGGGVGSLFGGGYRGGSGGGASDIRFSPYSAAARVVVAGGAGGDGYNGVYYAGGAGGGLTGGQGNGTGLDGSTLAQGGTQSAGGAGGNYPGYPPPGSSGGLATGGDAGGGLGGGGGGGYYGGGGGVWCGGGGGSSYASSTYCTGVTMTSGYNTGGHGMVILTPAVSAPSVSISASTNVACNGGATGSATASVSGGTTPYTYSWAPSGGTGATASSLAAGSYTVTVTDAASVTATATVTITQPSTAVSIGSISGGNYCVGSTVNLSASGAGGVGGYTYSWSGPMSFSSTSATPSISGATTGRSGTYSVTVTDANGCSVMGTVGVTVNNNPSASTGSAFTCDGGSITLSNATGGGTWSSSNTAIATVGSLSGVVTGVDSGTVNITYTVGTGCFDVKSIEVKSPMAAITGTPYVCLNTTSDLDHVLPGGTWSVATPYYATVDASTGVITGAHSGGTTVTYTVNSGCSVTAGIYTSNVILNITGSLGVCVGSTSMLTVPGYAGSTWSTPDSATAFINATTGALLGVSAGTVPVTVTYGYCYTSAIATVNPVPASISGGSAVCAGSTLSLSCSTGGGVWSSSNTAKATVNSSGVVTGVASGTATISYTIGAGCAATKIVSVGSMPASITGTSTVCVGATTNLACTTLGGTWSSSATGTADVVSGTVTGIASYATISGVAAGGATISYSMPTGCVQTVNVTVATPPSSIGGTLAICSGGSSTLTSSGGGTWSSSLTTVATIGSATGIVTGGSTTGTATITYRTSSTCYTTAVVTVSTPSAISGPASVCKAYTVTMTHGTGGGTWSSSNTAVATVDPTTGVVTGVLAGAVNITYNISTGCFAVKALQVYNNPSAISGTGVMCVGGSVSMTGTSGTGTTWSSSNPSVATIGSSTGLVTGVSAGSADVTYTIASTGCYTTRTVSVNETPSAITGSSAICAGSNETYISTPTGGTWSSTAPTVGSINASTGTATGIAGGGTTIKYLLSSGCFVTKAITVNALPVAISGTTLLCVGNSVVLSSTTTGATWSTSASGTASITATTATTATVAGISSGVANISYTNAAGCSRVAVVTVNDAVASIEGPDVICSGNSVTFTNATSGGTWGTSSAGRVGIVSATGVATGGTTVGSAVITYRTSAACFAIKYVTNNASVANITGTTSVCVGATTTFANSTSGGTWSSSGTMAMVDAASGLIMGMSAGTNNISYIVSEGCYKTKAITVKALPTISGADMVSTGATTTLSGAPTPGTWSSSATGTATINVYGVVSGVAAGSVTISYYAGGCYGTWPMTVNEPSSRPAGMTEESVVLFSVFPNPTHGSLSVSTGVAGTFAIFTVDGKLASASELTEGVNAINMPVGMAAGTYLCRFQGVDGSVQAVRLVYEP